MCDTYCNGQTDTHLVISQIWSTDRLGSISNRMRATMSTNGPQKRVHSSIQDIAWQHEDLLQHWIKGRCDEGSVQVGRTPVPRLLHIWDVIEHLEPLNMKLHWYQLTMPGTTGGVSDVFDHTKCLVLIHYDCTLKMETYVCECFNSLEVDEKKVDKLIVETDGKSMAGPKGKAAQKELWKIYSNMKAEPVNMKGARGAMYAIHECMDKHFLYNTWNYCWKQEYCSQTRHLSGGCMKWQNMYKMWLMNSRMWLLPLSLQMFLWAWRIRR